MKDHVSRMEEEESKAEDIITDGTTEAPADRVSEVAFVPPMSDAEFDAELKDMMEETSVTNKKKDKKKKGTRKKWSRKKKIIITAAIVLVGLAAGVMATGSGKKVQPMVTTMPLTKGDVVEQLSVSGPVEGTDSVEVVSNLHAEILTLSVKEGDKVEKGQLLATLDDKDAKKGVDIAQNAYDLAISTYNEKQAEAENGYEKAQQDYKASKDNYDRTNVLFQSGSLSLVDLENASNALKDAERQLKSFTLKDGRPVANESFEIQIENAAFELDQKKESYANTQVISPIAGTVVRVNCKVGRFADKTDDDKPMFIIENLDVLEMKINVSEYSIGKVAIGQPVEINADILNGQSVTGEVTAISPTGEEKGNGSTERVIPTTIRIIDQNTLLIAGITAKARIELQKAENVWKVPVSALIQQTDGTMAIAAVEDNIVHMIPVDTGVESDIEIEIIPKEEGSLTDTMQIIGTPMPGTTEGMAVVVAPAE